MSEIEYVRGDATAPHGKGVKLIAHVCNDLGGWGKGFVLAISRRWAEPEAAYRRWHRERAGNDFGLGAVQFVQVGPYVWVANMVGQRTKRSTPRSARWGIRPWRSARPSICRGSAAGWRAGSGRGSSR
jgi:O-acetyl-ADP-ribose deacetylase (regulator of RNase III)